MWSAQLSIGTLPDGKSRGALNAVNAVNRSYPDNEPLPFDVIAAFLRLGQKYEIQPLYDSALRRLMHVFSSSLEGHARGGWNKHVLFNDTQDTNRRCEIAIDTIVLFTSGPFLAYLGTHCLIDTQKYSVPCRHRQKRNCLSDNPAPGSFQRLLIRVARRDCDRLYPAYRVW
jgi:hypothetical protein